MTFLPSPCLVEWQSPHCGGHIWVPKCTVLSLKIDWWPPPASGLFLFLVRSVSCNYCWKANIHSLVQELVHPHHVNPLRAPTKRTRSTQWPKSSGYLLTAINLPFYCSISHGFTGLCCETRHTLRTFFQNGSTPWRANRQQDRDILKPWSRADLTYCQKRHRGQGDNYSPFIPGLQRRQLNSHESRTKMGN